MKINIILGVEQICIFHLELELGTLGPDVASAAELPAVAGSTVMPQLVTLDATLLACYAASGQSEIDHFDTEDAGKMIICDRQDKVNN